MFNGGLRELARRQAEHTLDVFQRCEAVIAPSGSCAAMVKVEYPHLFDTGTALHERACELAGKTFELSDFLVNRLQVLDVGARFDGRVACHFACHLRLLQQSDEVERLVRNVQGVTCVPLPRQDQCCGFGGSFAVRYPQISNSLVDDKVRQLLSVKADAVVSTDSGCLMNLGGRLHRAGHRIQVLHIAELLDRR
jgi:L-lactate dehydrogenase complex protein LldE